MNTCLECIWAGRDDDFGFGGFGLAQNETPLREFFTLCSSNRSRNWRKTNHEARAAQVTQSNGWPPTEERDLRFVLDTEDWRTSLWCKENRRQQMRQLIVRMPF